VRGLLSLVITNMLRMSPRLPDFAKAVLAWVDLCLSLHKQGPRWHGLYDALSCAHATVAELYLRKGDNIAAPN
jgi:hypothetical protein